MPDEFTRSPSSRHLCRYFLKGSCRHGERCRYPHTNPDSTVRYVELFEFTSHFIHRRHLFLVLAEQDDAGGIVVTKTFHPQKHMRQV